MSKEKETPTIDEKQYQQVIADVQAAVAELLKSEKLVKSHPGEENSSEPPKDTSASETAPTESAPESKEPPAEETPSAAPPTEAAPAGPPAEEAAPPAEIAQEQGPLDPAALKAEYCQLPLEDLQVHFLAAKEALVEKMGQQQQMAQPPAEPAPAPAAAPPAPAAPAPSGPPMAMKSEVESQLETLKKKQADTDEMFDKLVQLMGKQMNVPLRKAVVSLVEIDGNKPQIEIKNLKKSEVQAILRKKLNDGKLSKSDQELVVKFDCNMIKIDQLAHLLTA